MTVFNDLTPDELMANRDHLFADLVAETCFGFNDFSDQPRKHPVMDDPLWTDRSFPLHRHGASASARLCCSGGGSHFDVWMRGRVVQRVN